MSGSQDGAGDVGVPLRGHGTGSTSTSTKVWSRTGTHTESPKGGWGTHGESGETSPWGRSTVSRVLRGSLTQPEQVGRSRDHPMCPNWSDRSRRFSVESFPVG